MARIRRNNRRSRTARRGISRGYQAGGQVSSTQCAERGYVIWDNQNRNICAPGYTSEPVTTGRVTGGSRTITQTPAGGSTARRNTSATRTVRTNTTGRSSTMRSGYKKGGKVTRNRNRKKPATFRRGGRVRSRRR